MKIYPIQEGVYQIALAWSNAYLLTEGGEVALIDTGLQQDREGLHAALAQIGVQAARVRAVYLTHAHCDHAGNAASLARQGATLHLHHEEARYLGLPRRTYVPSGWQRLTRPHLTLVFTACERLYPVERCEIGRALCDGDTVDAPGGPLRVVACPGHTPGHVAYFRERDGLLFSGDAVLNLIPVRRVPGLSLPMRVLTENWKQAQRSVSRLAALRPAVLLAGHGGPLREDTAERLSRFAERMKDEG